MKSDKSKFPGGANSQNNSKNTLGRYEDLSFFIEDQWLQDTEVIYNIHSENGRWTVYLVFASVHNSFRFIRKKINSFQSEARARLCAELYQRGARKDPRGTLKVNLHDFNICYN
jgi:hypothetical protein